MTCKSLRFLFASTLTLSLALTACGDSRTDTASATAASESSGSTEAPTTSGVPTTSVGTDSASGTSAGTGSTSSDTSVTGGASSGGVVCNDPPDQPDNSECTEDCGCMSGHCFNYVLGATCGQCNTDADCPNGGGCSIPNPLAGTGSTCNMGEPGAGCNSDAVCKDPDHAKCGVIIDVAPIITLATCGQCQVNADCAGNPGGPNCNPTVDVMNFKGELLCVMDGSVEVDQACSLEKVGMGVAGDTACKSGHCGDAVFMGLLHVGVCGECGSDADCAMGQTCSEPMIDTMGGALIGAKCM